MLKNYEGVYYKDWPAAEAKAAMLLVHGMGAHPERFNDLAARMNAEKISCYGIALQGFGDIAGEDKGHIDSMKIYHESLLELKKFVSAEKPGKPVFILGESMGGVIATVQALHYDPDFAGLIPISPAYRDVLKISPLQRVGIFLSYIVKGKTPVKMPFVSEELTRDTEVLARLKSDPREHRMASASLLFGNLVEMIDIMMNIGKIKVPVLMLLSGKDYLADTPYSIGLFKRIRTEKKYIVYPDSLHALTIEQNREEVFGDIVKWVNHILANK